MVNPPVTLKTPPPPPVCTNPPAHLCLSSPEEQATFRGAPEHMLDVHVSPGRRDAGRQKEMNWAEKSSEEEIKPGGGCWAAQSSERGVDRQSCEQQEEQRERERVDACWQIEIERAEEEEEERGRERSGENRRCGCKLYRLWDRRGSSCRAGGERAGGLPWVSSEWTRMLRLHQGKRGGGYCHGEGARVFLSFGCNSRGCISHTCAVANSNNVMLKFHSSCPLIPHWSDEVLMSSMDYGLKCPIQR